MTIQVLDRAVRILRVIAKQGSASLTDLSKATHLPLPTVARIATSLTDNGMLQRLGNRKYQLGARFVPMTGRLEYYRRPLEIVRPFIEDLSSMTQEDCGLALLQGNEAVVVDWCYGPHPPHVIEPYSREIPLHCAFGMVLIAFQPARWRERYLKNVELKKLAAGTVTDQRSLSACIEKVRHTGIHISMAQNIDGAGSLTVPVFDHFSRLYGGLFITAPLERLSEVIITRHSATLVETAKEITNEFRRVHRVIPLVQQPRLSRALPARNDRG